MSIYFWGSFGVTICIMGIFAWCVYKNAEIIRKINNSKLLSEGIYCLLTFAFVLTYEVGVLLFECWNLTDISPLLSAVFLLICIRITERIFRIYFESKLDEDDKIWAVFIAFFAAAIVGIRVLSLKMAIMAIGSLVSLYIPITICFNKKTFLNLIKEYVCNMKSKIKKDKIIIGIMLGISALGASSHLTQNYAINQITYGIIVGVILSGVLVVIACEIKSKLRRKKREKFMKIKYWKWILIGIVISVSVPALLDIGVFGNSISSNLTNGEWSAFLGSYLGAIIGGVISLIGILVTIRFTQQENEKERELNNKAIEKAQEIELHLMVVELVEDINSCGEAILSDVETKICPNMEFQHLSIVEPVMLKKARKLLAYANIRSAATNRLELDFTETFGIISTYSKELNDICRWTSTQICVRPCDAELVRNSVQKKLIEVRQKVERGLMEYSRKIVR